MAFQVGEISAGITANDVQFRKALDKAKKAGEKWGAEAGRIFQDAGKKMTTFVTAPILGIGIGMIKAASDAEETSAKFQTVFRDISKVAAESANELTRNYGLSSNASKQLLGDTGDLLTGFGFTQKSALELSTSVNKLAVDLASFTNFSGGAEGASQALTKALLGERESVKSLGISILEADVQARVLTNTQAGLTFETERQAKAFATLQLAQEQSKNAIGDFARTQDSFANQMRQLKAEVADLAVEFGSSLLPVANELIGDLRELTERFSGMSTQAKKNVIAIAGYAAIAGPTILFFGALVKALASLKVIIPIVTAGVNVLTAALVANPIIAVGAAIAVLGTKALNAAHRVKDLREEVHELVSQGLGADQFTRETFDELEKKISGVRSRIRELKNNKLIFIWEKKELDQLERELKVLLGHQNNLSVAAERHFAEIADGADDAADSYAGVRVAVEQFKKAVERPVNKVDSINDILGTTPFKNVQQLIDSVQVPNFGEMMFPAGSLGDLQGRMAFLREEMLSAFDPEVQARIREELQLTQEQIDAITGETREAGSAGAYFGSVIGNALAQATLHAKKFSDILKNLLKQLASQVFVKGISLLLSGGFSGGGSILKKLFSFHTGGIVPGTGERMILAKGGEGVFTEGQMAAMGNMMNRPSGGSDSILKSIDNRLANLYLSIDNHALFIATQKGKAGY